MAETAVILDFDTKNEKLRNIQKKIKVGTTGKAKLNNMRKLLERNSEQLKQKISEYFERHRKILDQRESKLLNKVNVFIDCRITEIDDKLKHLQEKLDHLKAYQCCLDDDNLTPDHSLPDDFDCFVAASRYNFCVERNGVKSSFKKFGVLKQVDVLVARLDSSDEDESDDDDANLCKDNNFVDAFKKKFNLPNKAVDAESSDSASSCSILSYKEVGEENEKVKIKVGEMECVDDYEFLTFDVPSHSLHVKPVVQVGKTLSTNLSDSEVSETTSTFETHVIIEKMLEAFKSEKMHIANLLHPVTNHTEAEGKTNKTATNQPSLADKVVNSIKTCQSRNEQKDISSEALCEFKNWLISVNKVKDDSSQELKIDDSAHAKTIKNVDHISNFNSRVEIILDKGASKVKNNIA